MTSYFSDRIFIFIFTFLITSFLGASLQLVILPYFLEHMHAGDGLIANGDWVWFHEIARDLANKMNQYGYSQWNIRPHNQGPAGVAAMLYYLSGFSSPLVMLFFNTILYSIFASEVFILVRTFFKINKWVFLLTPILIFPSTVLIYGQIHKDIFSILAIILSLNSLFFLWKKTTESYLKDIVFSFIRLNFAMLLLLIARPYMVEVVFLAWLLALIPSMFFWVKYSEKNYLALFAYLILIVASFSFFFYFASNAPSTKRPALTKVIEDRTIGKEAAFEGEVNFAEKIVKSCKESCKQEKNENILGKQADYKTIKSEFAFCMLECDKKEVSSEIIEAYRTAVRDNTPIEDVGKYPYTNLGILDALTKKIYSHRRAILRTSGSHIDQDMQLRGFIEFLINIPRILQVAYFAPFPEFADQGSGKANSKMNRIVAKIEMYVFYALMLLFLMKAFKYKQKIDNHNLLLILAVFTFCSIILLIIAAGTPNLGTLYRLRFAPWHIITAMIFSYIFSTKKSL